MSLLPSKTREHRSCGIERKGDRDFRIIECVTFSVVELRHLVGRNSNLRHGGSEIHRDGGTLGGGGRGGIGSNRGAPHDVKVRVHAGQTHVPVLPPFHDPCPLQLVDRILHSLVGRRGAG